MRLTNVLTVGTIEYDTAAMITVLLAAPLFAVTAVIGHITVTDSDTNFSLLRSDDSPRQKAYAMTDSMTLPDELGDDITDAQADELQRRVRELWMPSRDHGRYDELVDRANDRAFDLIDERGTVYPADELNEDLLDYISDMVFRRVDNRVGSGELPKCDGHAYDALSEAVADVVAEIHDDTAITEEDIHEAHTRTDVNPRYERSLGL